MVNKDFLNRNKFFWVLAVIVCLFIIVSTLFINDEKIDKELDTAISKLILKEYKDPMGGELLVEAHKVLGVDKNKDKTEIYLMATYSEYEFQNNIFELVSGASAIPMKITFLNDKSDKTSLDYLLKHGKIETAQDGGMYRESVYKMFPFREAVLVLHSHENNSISDELLKEVNKDAEVYVKKLGRKAKVTYDYVDKKNIDEVFIDKIINEKKLDDYPRYIGTREKIENNKRYIYTTNYSKDSKVVVFTKLNEDRETVEEYIYEINGDKAEKLESDKYISYRCYGGQNFLSFDEFDIIMNEIKITGDNAKFYVDVKNKKNEDISVSLDKIKIGFDTKSVDFKEDLKASQTKSGYLIIKDIPKINTLFDKHTGSVCINNKKDNSTKKVEFLNKF